MDKLITGFLITAGLKLYDWLDSPDGKKDNFPDNVDKTVKGVVIPAVAGVVASVAVKVIMKGK